MGLENTFGNAEKVEKEKKIKVVTSVDSVVNDLKSYFERSIPSNFKTWKDDFKSFTDYLQIFRITPEIITKINEKLPEKNHTKKDYGNYKGVFISAMMQTSYNQGFNDFKFEEVDADWFGAFLKGQPKNPIKITTETLKGEWSLFNAKNCVAEITKYKEGGVFGYERENCTIKSSNLETLKMIKKQSYIGLNNRFELKK